MECESGINLYIAALVDHDDRMDRVRVRVRSTVSFQRSPVKQDRNM